MGRRENWTAEEDAALVDAKQGRKSMTALAKKMGRSVEGLYSRRRRIGLSVAVVETVETRPKVSFLLRTGMQCGMQMLKLGVVEKLAGHTREAELLKIVSNQRSTVSAALAMLQHIVPKHDGDWDRRKADWRDMYVPFAMEVLDKLPSDACVIEGADVVAFVARDLTGMEVLERVRTLGTDEAR